MHTDPYISPTSLEGLKSLTLRISLFQLSDLYKDPGDPVQTKRHQLQLVDAQTHTHTHTFTHSHTHT